MPSYDSSIRNLARARQRWRRPRPWRSSEESQMVRRFVFQWLTCRDRSRPAGRAWARELSISHTWLQKLVREYTVDASEMHRLQAVVGEPRSAELDRAKEYTREMRARGELRTGLRNQRYLNRFSVSSRY